ncbi:hypothetical protein EMIT0P100_80152 [Pseudomonas sp. IT-P100]
MLVNAMVFYIKEPHLFAGITYLGCHRQRIVAVYERRYIDDWNFSESCLFTSQPNIK